MEEMYFELVINHKRTCDEKNTTIKLVPSVCRVGVSALLNERGYDLDGNML